ncbi:RidA family protein [Kocuria coralli]|uniref:RidA family protein n=1 Tax=Kocuria coralli TaxID=1461025 RepID=A0A5J5L046_9MICC|nr:RidA family protein [Kocuria coralli]KAA9395319.1 RidA family protein [Kocuria coralli]
MSGGVDRRLADLGLSLPEVPAPAGVYVPALVTGNYVHTSGQLPFIDGELPETGKVGDGLVSPERAQELAAVAALNALAAVKNVIGDLDRIIRIVKVVGFVASDPEFFGQPGVLNGASNLLGDVLGSAGVHARSAVGVAVLPLNSPVEVELLAEFA